MICLHVCVSLGLGLEGLQALTTDEDVLVCCVLVQLSLRAESFHTLLAWEVRSSSGLCFRFFLLMFFSLQPLFTASLCNVEGIQSNALNSDWQEPSRLRLTGVSDLTAVATLQEFLHGISMGSVLFCLFAVLNLSLLYQYL